MTEKEREPRKPGRRQGKRGPDKRRPGYDSPPSPRSVPSDEPDVNQQEERPRKGGEEGSPGSE